MIYLLYFEYNDFSSIILLIISNILRLAVIFTNSAEISKNESKRVYCDKRIFSPENKSELFRLFRSEVLKSSDISFEHHHTAFEITMVIEGSGRYSTVFSDFEYKKGDIFCFCSNEVHKITKLYARSAFLTFHFEPRFVWSDRYGIADYDLLTSFFLRKEQRLNMLDEKNESTQKIKNLMFETEKELIKEQTHFKTAVRINLMSVLLELSRGYNLTGGETENYKIGSDSAGYIDKAINYINENLEYDIDLATLADIAKMSRNYFCTLFKKLNGISPWEYITIKRIERAVEYLKTTKLTRLEIATKCGFNNTANFYHAFRKVTGKNPGDYIRG